MELFNNMVTALLKLIHCIVCFTFKQCIHSFFINNLLTHFNSGKTSSTGVVSKITMHATR